MRHLATVLVLVLSASVAYGDEPGADDPTPPPPPTAVPTAADGGTSREVGRFSLPKAVADCMKRCLARGGAETAAAEAAAKQVVEALKAKIAELQQELATEQTARATAEAKAQANAKAAARRPAPAVTAAKPPAPQPVAQQPTYQQRRGKFCNSCARITALEAANKAVQKALATMARAVATIKQNMGGSKDGSMDNILKDINDLRKVAASQGVTIINLSKVVMEIDARSKSNELRITKLESGLGNYFGLDLQAGSLLLGDSANRFYAAGWLAVGGSAKFTHRISLKFDAGLLAAGASLGTTGAVMLSVLANENISFEGGIRGGWLDLNRVVKAEAIVSLGALGVDIRPFTKKAPRLSFRVDVLAGAQFNRDGSIKAAGGGTLSLKFRVF